VVTQPAEHVSTNYLPFQRRENCRAQDSWRLMQNPGNN
jgi:hypothetical protein